MSANIPLARYKQNITTSRVELSHFCCLLYVVFLLGSLTKRVRCGDQRLQHTHSTYVPCSGTDDHKYHGRLARWRKWNSCDIGEAKEGLENELWRRWSDWKLGEWANHVLVQMIINSHGRLARWRKWNSCDIGEAKEGLENELWRRWSDKASRMSKPCSGTDDHK